MSASLVQRVMGVDGENVYLLTNYQQIVKSRLKCLACDIGVTKTSVDLSIFLLTRSASGYMLHHYVSTISLFGKEECK